LRPQEIIPLDYPALGNEVINFDISVTGATQTGTLDTHIGLLYCDTMPPQDWRNKFPNMVPMRGSVCNWDASATTAELILNVQGASSDNRIPGWAREIIGIRPVCVKDGAVTAAEEMIAYIRLEGSGVTLGTSKWPTNALLPKLGTEVSSAAMSLCPIIPAHVPLPGRDCVITAYGNMYAAVTANLNMGVGIYFR